MASSLKNWLVQTYRSLRARRLRHAIKAVDYNIREWLGVARETLRISNEALHHSSAARNIIDEVRTGGVDTIDIVEEIRSRGRDAIDIIEEIRNKERDVISAIEEVRKQNNAHDDRLRRVELYLLCLMKQNGVALKTLSAEVSDSQRPARESDIGFIKLEITKGSVLKNIDRIRTLSELQCRDVDFLEHALIPELGLSEESWAFPPEVAALSGKGLHLLQLPCQVAPFLAWLTDNARGIESYLEIGVRWGGMFILISEWLRRFSPEFRRAGALDPAEVSPLIREYTDFIRRTDGNDRFEVRYLKEYSTSADAKDMIMNLRPDFVFIDGDHRYEGVSHDYELVRGQANILMFHDICASTWPGVGRLWREVVRQNSSAHAVIEFTKQYKSGDGRDMGIGVIRKDVSSPGFCALQD